MLDDGVWSLSQRSRLLQDLRSDLRGIWRDEAARELNRRYLDPHHGECGRLLAALREQAAKIAEAATQCIAVEEMLRETELAAERVRQHLGPSELDVRDAYRFTETFSYYDAEAQARFPRIRDLLSQADCACSNVPTEG